jgi:hypothetical protein
MRRAFALTLLALLVAGCSAGTTDDQTPPNADPNGQQTFPPVASTSSTGPPDTNSSTPTSNPTAAPRPASFGAHDQEDTTTDDDFPSLMVSGRLQGSGPQLRIEATANNLGERAYRIPDGMCKQPWSESMTGPAGTMVDHRQPFSSCAAFGLKPFPGHDYLSKELTWNGTVWDEATGTYVSAPSGTYVWTVTFDVYDGGSGAQFDEHSALTLSFDVHVP